MGYQYSPDTSWLSFRGFFRIRAIENTGCYQYGRDPYTQGFPARHPGQTHDAH